MNSIRRHVVSASVTSLLVFLAWSSPAWAIHPMGFRFMPVFRITPAMNGMSVGMPMNRTFNVQTGVMAVPRFHHEMWWHNNWMSNRLSNSLYSGAGNMMGTSGSYPSMSSYGGGGGGGGYGQMSSVPQPGPSYESNEANGPLAPMRPRPVESCRRLACQMIRAI